MSHPFIFQIKKKKNSWATDIKAHSDTPAVSEVWNV